VGLAGADVLLLAAAGHLEAALSEGVDIAYDCTNATIEQAEREVLVTEQAILVASLSGDAEDARSAQALNTVLKADVEVLLSIIEGEPDGNLLALIKGLAGTLGGVDDQELDLAEAELVVRVVGVESEDLLDDREDGLGDERWTVGSLLDATTEHAVDGLGVESALTQLCLEELSPQHGWYLQK
jgi:hypothetical protein